MDTYSYYCIALVINIGIIAFLVYSFVQKREGEPNNFFQLPLVETPAQFGNRLGFIMSLCLSIAYALLGVFLIETFTEFGSGNFLIVWGLGSPLIFLVAILPAVLLGVLTGRCLSILVNQFRKRFSITISVLSGLVFCMTIVVLFHLVFNIQVEFSFVSPSTSVSFGIYESYLFYLGIPSIIYVLSGGWASWYIYKKFEANQVLF